MRSEIRITAVLQGTIVEVNGKFEVSEFTEDISNPITFVTTISDRAEVVVLLSSS
jgi:hypothetical protein